MKLQAVILSLVFLLGGSGLNVDIVKCCQQLSGIHFAFTSENQSEKTDCKSCEAIEKTACCSNAMISLSIHPEYSAKSDFKASFQMADLKTKPNVDLQLGSSQNLGSEQFINKAFDQHYPVPVLLKKRVLQI